MKDKILPLLLIALALASVWIVACTTKNTVSQYPYKVITSTGEGWAWNKTTIFVDSFHMESKTKITIYKDGLSQIIICDVIAVGQNFDYNKPRK